MSLDIKQCTLISGKGQVRALAKQQFTAQHCPVDTRPRGGSNAACAGKTKRRARFGNHPLTFVCSRKRKRFSNSCKKGKSLGHGRFSKRKRVVYGQVWKKTEN